MKVKFFVSIRKAAEFIGIHPSYLAKSIKSNNFYLTSKFLVYKSSTPLEEIFYNETNK